MLIPFLITFFSLILIVIVIVSFLNIRIPFDKIEYLINLEKEKHGEVKCRECGMPMHKVSKKCVNCD